MVNVCHYEPTRDMLDEPALALFQQQWQLYRKFVDNNYFFHREVYSQLHRILVDEAVQPFRFLDIACGDARATVDALKGTRVAHYHGIDLSEAALDLASKTLEKLACPVRLDHRDFVAALRDRPEPVDVAWIGLSLHHLLAPAKLTLMREIRSVVGDRGLFLIYENASPDVEDREASDSFRSPFRQRADQTDPACGERTTQDPRHRAAAAESLQRDGAAFLSCHLRLQRRSVSRSAA